MRPLTVFDRRLALDRLSAEVFDVLVIGGGITGCGVLLDAASRGLSAALVEREDFASGTSSKSSKLVHGGLRYLQQREFALVRESLVERQRLLRNGAGIVEPLKFVVPIFSRGGAVDAAVVRGLSSALFMYDIAGGFRIGSRHRRIAVAELEADLPTLASDKVAAGFSYYDARADDARLTLAVCRTAVLAHGAVACNHAPVTGLLRDRAGRVTGATVEPAAGATLEVRAKVVVNATGVFADDVALLEGGGPHAPSLRPAKGVHLTVSATKLPCKAAAVLPVPRDRRSIFVIPWDGHTYIGTTDTDYRGSLDSPAVSEEDVSYLLAAVNAAVRDPLSASDVTAAWAGLRPLLAAQPGRRRPSARTADLSRRHRVSVSAAGLVTVTGGKLTTYRKMAEETVDALEPVLGRLAPSRTRHLSLRGSTHKGATGGLPARLVSRYGPEAGAVVALVATDPSLGAPLVDGLSYSRAEAIHALRYEMAESLCDVLIRRTRSLLLDQAATLRDGPAVADLIGDELGWSSERRHDEQSRLEAAAALEMSRPPGPS